MQSIICQPEGKLDLIHRPALPARAWFTRWRRRGPLCRSPGFLRRTVRVAGGMESLANVVTEIGRLIDLSGYSTPESRETLMQLRDRLSLTDWNA